MPEQNADLFLAKYFECVVFSGYQILLNWGKKLDALDAIDVGLMVPELVNRERFF